MSHVITSWDHYWFTPESALRLGICRAMFYSLLFALYLFTDWSGWREVDRIFWMPDTPYNLLYFIVPYLGVIGVVWKASLLTSALGLFTRVSTAVAFLGGAILLATPHQFGKLHHDDALLVLVLGILAFSQCGHAFSLDSFLNKRDEPESSGAYRWPIRAVWLCMSVIFFSAGFIKAVPNGIGYVFSDTMGIYLARQFLGQSSVDPILPYATFIYASPVASRLLAAATIGIELFFPVVLVSLWARRLFVPAAFVGQIVIYLIMGPPFIEFWICYLFFIPWERVATAIFTRYPAIVRH